MAHAAVQLRLEPARQRLVWEFLAQALNVRPGAGGIAELFATKGTK
jgi:hypothetical protein